MPEHFDVRDIKNSEYSDFILGCSPHNMKGVNGGALIHQIKTNPSIYPKLHTSAEHRMTLKLSITMFKKFLLESRYLKQKNKRD